MKRFRNGLSSHSADPYIEFFFHYKNRLQKWVIFMLNQLSSLLSLIDARHTFVKFFLVHCTQVISYVTRWSSKLLHKIYKTLSGIPLPNLMIVLNGFRDPYPYLLYDCEKFGKNRKIIVRIVVNFIEARWKSCDLGSLRVKMAKQLYSSNTTNIIRKFGTIQATTVLNYQTQFFNSYGEIMLLTFSYDFR